MQMIYIHLTTRHSRDLSLSFAETCYCGQHKDYYIISLVGRLFSFLIPLEYFRENIQVFTAFLNNGSNELPNLRIRVQTENYSDPKMR